MNEECGTTVLLQETTALTPALSRIRMFLPNNPHPALPPSPVPTVEGRPRGEGIAPPASRSVVSVISVY